MLSFRFEERDNKIECDSNADGGVGDIEGRERIVDAIMEIEKIDHIAIFDAIDEISKNAPREEPDTEARETGTREDFVTRMPEEAEHANRDGNQHGLLTRKDTPSGPPIENLTNGKKLGDDGIALSELEMGIDPILGDLVGEGDEASER